MAIDPLQLLFGKPEEEPREPGQILMSLIESQPDPVARRGGGGGARLPNTGNGWRQLVPDPWERFVAQAARRHGVDPNVIASVGEIESGWENNLTSSAGAQGPMQIMPLHGLGKRAFRPRANIMKGASILSDYGYGRDPLKRVLASYNAGPGNVGAGMDYAQMVLNVLRGL